MAIAINGTGTLTGVSVGGLPDGIVDTDMLAASAVTAAKATGSAKGITEHDEWRVHSDFSAATTAITSNWERVDNNSNSVKIGTGWTESSGIFTPASNGIYRIHFQTLGQRNETQFMGVAINYSIDSGSNYATLSFGRDSNSGSTSDTWCQAICSASLDVTNYANTRIKFTVDSSGTFSYKGHTDYNSTWCSFTRLGDT